MNTPYVNEIIEVDAGTVLQKLTLEAEGVLHVLEAHLDREASVSEFQLNGNTYAVCANGELDFVSEAYREELIQDDLKDLAEPMEDPLAIIRIRQALDETVRSFTAEARLREQYR